MIKDQVTKFGSEPSFVISPLKVFKIIHVYLIAVFHILILEIILGMSRGCRKQFKHSLHYGNSEPSIEPLVKVASLTDCFASFGPEHIIDPPRKRKFITTAATTTDDAKISSQEYEVSWGKNIFVVRHEFTVPYVELLCTEIADVSRDTDDVALASERALTTF